MTHNTTKRGVALIWTLLTISILLFVTSTMANYIIRESQMSVRLEDSTRAYALAQSGIEWSKQYAANHTDSITLALDSENIPLSDVFGADTGTVTVSVKRGSPTDPVKIISEGSYAGVGRKLQYTIVSNVATEITKDKILGGAKYSTDASYDFQFDIWKKVGSTQSVQFGLSDGTKKLTVVYDGSSMFTISAASDSVNPPKTESTSIIEDGGPYTSTSTSHAIRVKVRYLESTAVQMTIYRMADPGGMFICNNTATIDLGGSDLSMLTANFISDKVLSLSSVDGSNVLEYSQGYIDNVYQHGLRANP